MAEVGATARINCAVSRVQIHWARETSVPKLGGCNPKAESPQSPHTVSMEEDSHCFKPNTLEQEIEQTKVHHTWYVHVCTVVLCNRFLGSVDSVGQHITTLEKSTLACLLASHRGSSSMLSCWAEGIHNTSNQQQDKQHILAVEQSAHHLKKRKQIMLCFSLVLGSMPSSTQKT